MKQEPIEAAKGGAQALVAGLGLQIEHRPVGALVPYARNARTHSENQVALIAGSIREYGWTSPILVDGTNGIIAGHGRVMAARKLGLATVPVIELAHLTETQKRALVLADNRLAEQAGWDREMLALEVADLAEFGIDLGTLGFEAAELGPGRCFPAKSPTSGTARCTRRRWPRAWRPAASRSAARSSGPRSGWCSRAVITTGSTSRAGTRCGRRARGIGTATASRPRSGRSRTATRTRRPFTARKSPALCSKGTKAVSSARALAVLSAALALARVAWVRVVSLSAFVIGAVVLMMGTPVHAYGASGLRRIAESSGDVVLCQIPTKSRYMTCTARRENIVVISHSPNNKVLLEFTVEFKARDLKKCWGGFPTSWNVNRDVPCMRSGILISIIVLDSIAVPTLRAWICKDCEAGSCHYFHKLA
jgi:ParB-like nuclease domain